MLWAGAVITIQFEVGSLLASRLMIARDLLVPIIDNFRRAKKGLCGEAEQKSFDYWIYCGNEAWSDSTCNKAPTSTSWSYYWWNGFGPVRHEKTPDVVAGGERANQRGTVFLLLDGSLSIVLADANFGFSCG